MGSKDLSPIVVQVVTERHEFHEFHTGVKFVALLKIRVPD